MMMRMFTLASEQSHLAARRAQMDRLLRLLRDDDEIEIVVSLLERASCYRGGENDKAAAALALCVRENWKLQPTDTCFLAKDIEESNTGSADAALQFLKTALFQLSSDWRGGNFLGTETPLAETTKWKNVVLVDDFVGSGRKVAGKVSWIRAHAKSPISVFVATFVAHEAAFTLVDPLVQGFHATEYLVKAISDFYKDPDTLETYISAMRRIEDRFGRIPKTCSLGFEDTQSIYFPLQWNSPNNVFPIFWTHSHQHDKDFKPILTRMPKK